MDRATLQNFFLLGNAGAAGQAAVDDPNGEVQGASQAFAGYPVLMQQYLQQQQQQQQQQLAAALDPRLASLGLAYPASQARVLPATGLMDVNRLQYLRVAQQPGQRTEGSWIGDISGQGDPYAESGILGPWSATSAGLLGKMAATSSNSETKGKKSRKKPKDRPKRPLSAYNIFFKEERQRILAKIPDSEAKEDAEPAEGKHPRKRKKSPHGKIGFENLAKVIGQRWQDLKPDEVRYYKDKAESDMKRYKEQMEEYLHKKDSEERAEQASEDVSETEEKPAKKVKLQEE